MRQSPDVVRRWANEVQEAATSDNPMVQLHALGVLYNIRKGDRLAVNKMVQKFSKTGMRSPYAVAFLIRIAFKLIEEVGGFGMFLGSCPASSLITRIAAYRAN